MILEEEMLQTFRAQANVPHTGIKIHGGALQACVIESARNPCEIHR